MSYTNKTTHYELPQYVATDKPKYLTDFNETMAAIDTQMYTNAQAAATADGKAVSAQSTADGAVSSIGTLNTQINGDPTDPSDTGLAGQVSGIDTDLDTVQSLIGSGEPTTSNQTIIGAINGLEGAVAPREDGDDLANSYSTGEQFARGGSVYEALVSLSAGTAFASLVLNTDYKVSDTLVEQISDAKGDIAGVLAKISGKTVITQEHSVIATVTADGVKTNKELLDELYTEVGTFKAALAANQSMVINDLEIGSGMPYKPTREKHIISTDSHTAIFVATVTSATSTKTRQVSFNGDTNAWIENTIDTNGFATASELSIVPADGTKFNIVATVYEVL